MILGCVIVIGPPFRICFLNNGITEPDEPNTLPKRTILKQVWEPFNCSDNACKHSSAIRLLAPITFVGRTALSVEMSTNDFTLCSAAHLATLYVPNTLFLTPSITLYSTKGTCLYAAA